MGPPESAAFIAKVRVIGDPVCALTYIRAAGREASVAVVVQGLLRVEPAGERLQASRRGHPFGPFLRNMARLPGMQPFDPSPQFALTIHGGGVFALEDFFFHCGMPARRQRFALRGILAQARSVVQQAIEQAFPEERGLLLDHALDGLEQIAAAVLPGLFVQPLKGREAYERLVPLICECGIAHAICCQ